MHAEASPSLASAVAGPASVPALAEKVAGAWVVSGLRKRILIPLGITLLLLMATLTSLLILSRHTQSNVEVAKTSAQIHSALEDRTQRQVRIMRSITELLAVDGELAAAMRARNFARLMARSQPLMQGLHAGSAISQLTFILPDHTAFLRTHAPAQSGDRIDRVSLLTAERTGRPTWRHEQGVIGTVTLRFVYPWRDQGELIGYIDLGVEFEELAEEVKRAVGAEVLLTVEKSRLNQQAYAAAPWHRPQISKWDEFPDVVVVTRTMDKVPDALRAFLLQAAAQQRERTVELEWPGHNARVITQPMRRDGEEIAQLLVLRDVSDDVATRTGAVRRLLLITILLGGALMFFFYRLLGKVQHDIAARTARLDEARATLALEHDERVRAERELATQQERNELLEARGRMVEELAMATRTAQEALADNEKITAKLRETQSELVATARQAGRAEIATNVLHNVGNVLNSVNVSASVIGGTLRKSRLSGLGRALAMLGEHEADIGEFLTRDEKGKMLPGYLAAIGGALAEEHKGMALELDRLIKSLDHIKDIVATQQSHAVAGHVIEPVRPADLAEDALRMQSTALARHHVKVVREFEAVPVLPLDRGRVLQILVNLISNAKAAMGELPAEARRLTVRIHMVTPSLLRIAVSDVGEGIVPENLTRIFAHGFTTRRDGHGFGLHSSALAAREVGGTLTASSAGRGTGATFTLELPVPAAQPA
jgi:signal transduction histidine kinase